MKKKIISALLLLTSWSVIQAQTTLTAWNFDNAAIGANSSPAPSSGFGTASAVGFGASNNPDVQSLPGSSSSGANSWRVRGTGSGGIGWSTGAAIAAQGAQFAASTFGYYQVQVSFDVYATADAEAALQVQYTTEGSIWHNATITSAGTSGFLATNTVTTNGLVVGNYLILTNNGTAAWNNQVTVNLAGISGVDNNANFAIRIVNASTGTNCLTTAGTLYNNNSGDWTFDNIAIQGVSFDTVANWPFDNAYVKNAIINSPVPAISNNYAAAFCIGFNTSYNFGAGNTYSTNSADITSTTPFSSTPNAPYAWRLRGAPGNGWYSQAPIGAQGAEFDVSTVNYSNILVNFDLYFTSQGEAKMCVLYTTDGWVTTNVANNLAYGANPTFIQTNTTSVNTVQGTYFYNTYGSIFYNNLVIDFTGVPSVANNPNFGFRIVNAATGFDCVNYINQPYNNNSGNGRLDNVSVNGQFTGLYSPVVTNSSVATVDGPFTNTFSVNPAWTAAIKSIYVNGVALTNTAYTITSSNIIFNPSKSVVLQLSGLDNIVINATGYTSSKVTQFVATGKAVKLTFTQPAGPSASGGTLTANPVIGITDQYGNGTTNPYTALTVTASVSNSAAWTLGGSTVQQVVNGYCTFTNLTATITGSSVVAGAAIEFSVAGYTNTATHTTTTNFYSTSFTIAAPPVPFTAGNLAVLQIDTLSNNTTFSVIELKPSAIGQTNPVNIVPISATGTNALRLSSAGSCGKLALSDDGTFLVFNAFQDGSSATADETFNLNRAVGTLNYTNGFTSPVSYVSTSFGGSQARAACSPDNSDFLICDKGGLYVNSGLSYEQNNIGVRSFGGVAWVLTAKVAYPPTPSLYQFGNGTTAIDWGNPGNDGPLNHASLTPPADGVAQDFYMIATNGTYGILYILDQNSGTNGASGVINKWSLSSDGFTWIAIGSWTNTDNGDTLFATTNGSGGVYLYYANGSGGQGGNQLIRLTDQTVGGPLNITSTNVIYTALASQSIAGITFVPQPAVYGTELTPTPILAAQAVAFIGVPFTISLTPDDSGWRSAITSITVNGSTLPSSAYDVTQGGKLVFNPAQSVLLQSTGAKTIVVNATGYSPDSVVQTIATIPQVGGYSVANGQLTLSFTNATGLSFSVLATNNLTAPKSTWPKVGSAVESPVGSGQYKFTDINATTNSAEFYILRQP